MSEEKKEKKVTLQEGKVDVVDLKEDDLRKRFMGQPSEEELEAIRVKMSKDPLSVTLAEVFKVLQGKGQGIMSMKLAGQIRGRGPILNIASICATLGPQPTATLTQFVDQMEKKEGDKMMVDLRSEEEKQQQTEEEDEDREFSWQDLLNIPQ